MEIERLYVRDVSEDAPWAMLIFLSGDQSTRALCVGDPVTMKADLHAEITRAMMNDFIPIAIASGCADDPTSYGVTTIYYPEASEKFKKFLLSQADKAVSEFLEETEACPFAV